MLCSRCPWFRMIVVWKKNIKRAEGKENSAQTKCELIESILILHIERVSSVLWVWNLQCLTLDFSYMSLKIVHESWQSYYLSSGSLQQISINTQRWIMYSFAFFSFKILLLGNWTLLGFLTGKARHPVAMNFLCAAFSSISIGLERKIKFYFCLIIILFGDR